MIVVCICIFHLREGTSWIPRYTYDSFWCISIETIWFQYVMLAVCISLLNVIWLILDLLGHPVTAHFDIPKLIPAHSQYLFIYFSCDCIDVSLLVTVARSFAYATKLTVDLGVPKVYP